MQKKSNDSLPYMHRDLSWLSFNHRVLQEAQDPSVPLFERIKFLGIYSSNLDEFFKVRVAAIKTLIRLGKSTKEKLEHRPEEILEKIRAIVTKHQIEFDKIYKNQIIPELRKLNIWILRPEQLEAGHKEYLDKFFKERLIHHLQPILLVKDKIRTYLSNNDLYLACSLETNGKNNRYAVVRIPTKVFNRYIVFPQLEAGKHEIIFLDDLVRYCLPYLFPGYEIKGAYSIKLTRDADIYIEDEYSGNLLEKIRRGIAKRKIGRGTRFAYDRKMPSNTLDFLIDALKIKRSDLQAGGRYTNNFDLFKFPGFSMDNNKYPPMPPLNHNCLEKAKSIFELMDKKDVLLHYPYQKYDYIIRMIEQAAHDPSVSEIKIVQYRVAKDSRIVSALRSAVLEGKKVLVFMEVKARFDEEANLDWGAKLESWGAKVVYSFPNLKVHAKVLLINRNDQQYVYLGTGNFNEDTALIYSDFGLLTTHKGIVEEVNLIFDFLENNKLPEMQYNHLLVGQFRMRRTIYQLIDQEVANKKAGKHAEIILKLNSIQDKRIIERLYKASQQGVKIKMIVRGICSLVPGIPGVSENIEIISIVDRFLEHSRVYLFHNDGDEKIFLSSADWMTRNLYYRIECAFPIYQQDLKKEIKEFLKIQFKDNCKARIIDEHHTNAYKKSKNTKKINAQTEIYRYYKNKL